jgi:pimeloyl-ACP methyl ester carboxylesterase
MSEKEDAIAAVQWARQKYPDLPLFLMGISMGGATVIHAAATGLELDGLILLDPLLQTNTAITRAAWTETGIPPALFTPSAWAATTFYGLPGPGAQALDVAAELRLPILLLQDPGDPVILAEHARELAGRNSSVTLWEAPEVAGDNPELAWRERWGSHVAAFALYPEQTMREILTFIARESPAP